METIEPSYVDFAYKVWTDIKTPGDSLLIFLLLVFLWWFFKNTKELGQWSLQLLNHLRAPKVKHKTKKDLLNHTIFNDIPYWLDNCIEPIFIRGDKVKLKIAKTMLRIDLQTALVWLKKLVENFDFERDAHSLRKEVSKQFEQLASTQWSEYKNRQIPDQFLVKFTDVNSINRSYITGRISDLLSEELVLNPYDKVYLILGSLDTYYSSLLTDLPRTVQATNGDLNGCIFEGEVIGGDNAKMCYLPPNINYKIPATNRLMGLVHSCKSSRATLYAFHDYQDDDILSGKVSCVYEAVTPGVSSVLYESSYQPVTPMIEIAKRLEKGETVLTYTKDAPSELSAIMHHKGIAVSLGSPIFIDNSLVGFVEVEWLREELLEFINLEDVKLKLETAAPTLAHYIDYNFKVEKFTREQ